MESPMRTSACMIDPSGRSLQLVTSASNAAKMNSINLGTPFANKYGVTVWNPAGIGWTAMRILLEHENRMDATTRDLHRSSLLSG
jgi:hypothetical protein